MKKIEPQSEATGAAETIPVNIEKTKDTTANAVTPIEKDESKDTAVAQPAASEDTQQPSMTQPATPQHSGLIVAPTPKQAWHALFAPENTLPAALRRKLGKAARPLTLALFLVVLAGAAASSWVYQVRFMQKPQPVSHFAAVKIPFQVVSTSPSDGQQNVDPSTKVTVRFNRPVDATKFNGDFFVSPTVNGTFSQGTNADEVVFTPSASFTPGTIVKVMLHGEFQSTDGEALGPDYFIGFTTALPDNSVRFLKDNFMETVDTAPANQKQTFTIQLGSSVADHTSLTTYKGTMQALLQSLEYANTQASPNYSYPDFTSATVPTAGLTQLAAQAAIKDGQTFDVNEDSGVYLITATNNGQQIGHLWVVYSNFGALLRQDDQKVVIAAQSFKDGSDITGHAVLYNLNGGVTSLAQSDLTGMTTIQLPLHPSLDAAVITSGSDQAFVPVSIIDSLADLRANKDLSKTNTIFGVTDRPTYHAGDTVKFAGFLRIDNDGNYSLPQSGTVHMYIASSRYDSHLADLTVPLSSSGQFSGSFVAASGMLDAQSSLQTLHLFADSGNPQYDNDVASFSLTSQTPATTSVQVAFGKPSYLPTDVIQATITAKDMAGNALGGATVHMTEYAKPYYENNPGQNLSAFGTVGDKVTDNTITLDSNGKATVLVDVSKLTAGSSQVVTIQATLNGTNTAIAAGGDSTIVHEGNASIDFGTSKTVVTPGGTLTSRVYTRKLDGSPLINASISYTLASTDTQAGTTPIASGAVTANGDGLAEIDIPLAANLQGTSLKLTAWTADQQNNKVEATDYYYIAQSNDSPVFSEVQLSNLDVYGASEDLTIGKTANLTINAPKAMRVLVTYERGRIHHNELLDLNQGTNNYPISVTSDLAPSFSLVFSYFEDGVYHTEGASYTVSPDSNNAAVSLAADQDATNPSNTAITLATQDASGKALATNAIVGIVEARAYDLSSAVAPDMFTALYSPREITTNASSSLTVIGSGGGRCGGGGQDQPEFANPEGAVAYWNPLATTDASGHATFTTQLPKGTWRVYAYTMNGDTIVGSAVTTVTVP